MSFSLNVSGSDDEFNLGGQILALSDSDEDPGNKANNIPIDELQNNINDSNYLPDGNLGIFQILLGKPENRAATDLNMINDSVVEQLNVVLSADSTNKDGNNLLDVVEEIHNEDKYDTKNDRSLVMNKCAIIENDKDCDVNKKRFIKKRTKKFAILDSDSDEEASSSIGIRNKDLIDVIKQSSKNSVLEQEYKLNALKSTNEITSVDDDKLNGSNNQRNKNISIVIDSDSDEEFPRDIKPNKQSVAKTNEHTLNSGSEQEFELSANNNNSDIRKNAKISNIIDSDSEENSEFDKDICMNEISPTGFHLRITDSENEEERIQRESKPSLQKVDSTATKNSVDTISKIKSESQRLHRETHVNVPYHKPRICSLNDFLNRKSHSMLNNIVKTKSAGSFPLKMSRSELEKYVKYLEIREVEAQELFKHELDEKSIVNALDFVDAVKVDTGVANTVSDEFIPVNNITNNNEENKIKIISNILIAPALMPMKKSLNIENLKNTIGFADSPTLKGDPSHIIDLDNDDFKTTAKPLRSQPGIETLFEKFRKTARNKRLSHQKISQQSSEDEIKNHQNDIDNKYFSQKDKKPGAGYITLQKNLKRIIVATRKSELEKKLKNFKADDEIVGKICAEEDDDYDSLSESGNEADLDDSSDADEIDVLVNRDNNDNEDTGEESDNQIENINDKPQPRTQGSDEMEILHEKQHIEFNGDELSNLPSQNFEQPVNNFAIPTTQVPLTIDESQLAALCSGKFDDKQMENVDNFNNDELDEDIIEEIVQSPTSHRGTKKIKTIQYSDDESDENSDIFIIRNNGTTDKNIKENSNCNTEVDSDENEIEVEMTETEKLAKLDGFFENEAELSESEWGSADEDEKGLDQYDVELGDEDEFDQEQLQAEVGKIHMRKVLDEDARELKKMQELLFEDEEIDGLGRQRQFKWKNADNSLNLNGAEGKKISDDIEQSGGSADEEDEEQWRKMKHEREVLLLEKKTYEAKNVEIISPLKRNNIHRIDQIENRIDTPMVSIKKRKITDSDPPFLITQTCSSSVRGSFLQRGGAILSKVAATINITNPTGINFGNDEHVEENIRVQSKTNKHNNFVFTTLSQNPSNENNKKRKLAAEFDLGNDKAKKTKHADTGNSLLKKNLIDHLNDM